LHLSTYVWMRVEPLSRSLERAAGLGYESVELTGSPTPTPSPRPRSQRAVPQRLCLSLEKRLPIMIIFC